MNQQRVDDSTRMEFALETALPVANLPDPDQFPDNDVVIWDGMCRFCHSQVVRLRGLDWRHRLSFISLHDPRVAERYAALTVEQLMAEMWVVTRDGQRFGGADAIRYLSRVLPSLWWLAPVMHLPFCMPLWRTFYRMIARRRYRLSGQACDGGTCHLHQ